MKRKGISSSRWVRERDQQDLQTNGMYNNITFMFSRFGMRNERGRDRNAY